MFSAKVIGNINGGNKRRWNGDFIWCALPMKKKVLQENN
jgi:hypothetical protein